MVRVTHRVRAGMGVDVMEMVEKAATHVVDGTTTTLATLAVAAATISARTTIVRVEPVLVSIRSVSTALVGVFGVSTTLVGGSTRSGFVGIPVWAIACVGGYSR